MTIDTDLSRPKPASATRGTKSPTPRAATGNLAESEHREDAQRPTTEGRSGEAGLPAGTAGWRKGAYRHRAGAKHRRLTLQGSRRQSRVG